MTAQENKPRSLKQLMEEGGGLSGFAWPEHEQEFGISIDRDGTWRHQGEPIRREKLVKLFATVLQRDDDGVYWLVTPGERGRVTVEDAPFVAVELDAESKPGVLRFRTNLDYWVEAGPDRPIRVAVDPKTGEPSPYVLVRDRLEALIARSVFYELVERAEERLDETGRPVLGVESAGTFFPLGAADDGAQDG
ncbi:MAG: DUF1285 domain-containing protein [Marivibrio sp.]|uniref:DUF1285 domain-containing protein n=1 Tax=Marivibrio sp. TaxID=2039719 RepID=UPI0032EC5725